MHGDGSVWYVHGIGSNERHRVHVYGYGNERWWHLCGIACVGERNANCAGRRLERLRWLGRFGFGWFRLRWVGCGGAEPGDRADAVADDACCGSDVDVAA